MNINDQSATQNPFDIKALLNAIILRRYVFIGVMLAVITASVVVSYSMKKMYKADTIVLVDAPGVVNPMDAKSSGTRRVKQRLSLIKQLLSNRASMAKVIRKLDLDLNIKNPYQYEALIEKIQSNLSTSTRRNNLFRISYIGEDPKVVRDIVNTLTTQYIEDSFQSKRSGASISTDFYNDQILYYKERLNDAESAVQIYLERNPAMALKKPAVELARAQSLQATLMKIKLQREELQTRLDLLNDQLSGKTPLTDTFSSGEDGTIKQLERLEEHLANLLLKYTANYPAVLKIKGEIAELNKGLDSKSKDSMSKEDKVQLRKQVKNKAGKYKTALGLLATKEGRIEKEMQRLQASLREIPGERKELVSLRRDVRVYEGLYNTLIKKFEEVKITKELEQREEPFIFKVINPAVLPIRPVKPDRVLFIIYGLIAGVVAGVVVVFGWENYLDTSIKSADSLKSSIGRLQVLAAIPNIVTDEVKQKTRKRDIWVFSATAAYLAIVGLILLLELASKYGLEVL